MTKVTALVNFHGSNYANLYEAGKDYYLREASAKALASQGLVKIADKEKPSEEPKDAEKPSETADVEPKAEEKAETVAKPEVEQEKPKRGRPSTK